MVGHPSGWKTRVRTLASIGLIGVLCRCESRMSDVINQIRSWSATDLKFWERAALEKVAARSQLTEADFEESVGLFLEDVGLRAKSNPRPRLSFPENFAQEAKLVPYRLVRLFNLKNVNALPDGQELHFGTALTLVYGDNGAGKTGYARPLASAGFARGERQVLPNAEHAVGTKVPQAEIELSDGHEKKIVTWINGQRSPELDGFYVFDGTSLTAHLSRSNSLGFSPSGLSLLTDLAEVTDKVRNQVRLLADERDIPRDFESFFESESETKNHLKNLGARRMFPPSRSSRS